MAIYTNYPKPSADKNLGRSASKVSSPSLSGQHHIGGAMGKHQKTGSGASGSKK